MTTPNRYYLSEIDGNVCVVCEGTDWNAPRIYTNHWPTLTKSRDLLRFYFNEVDLSTDESRKALLAKFQVRQSIPGEYWIDSPNSWQNGVRLNLVNGGRTESVATTFRDAPKPKRAKRFEWRDGSWQVERAAGWVRVHVDLAK